MRVGGGLTGIELGVMGKVIPKDAGAAERAQGPIGVIEYVTPNEAGAAERAVGPVGVIDVNGVIGVAAVVISVIGV